MKRTTKAVIVANAQAAATKVAPPVRDSDIINALVEKEVERVNNEAKELEAKAEAASEQLDELLKKAVLNEFKPGDECERNLVYYSDPPRLRIEFELSAATAKEAARLQEIKNSRISPIEIEDTHRRNSIRNKVKMSMHKTRLDQLMSQPAFSTAIDSIHDMLTKKIKEAA